MLNIYVANLAKYNEGELVGEWIELPCSDLEDRIQKILGEDEEYAIHDYECEFLKIDEWDNPYELNELAETLEGLSGHDERKLKALLEWGRCSDTKEALEELESYILYEDIENDYDLGYYWVNDSGCYDLKSMGSLANYIDYEAFGRDISMERDGAHTSYGWIEVA